MLRVIISIYKSMLIVAVVLALVFCVLAGVAFVIEGSTPTERWNGLALIVFGPLGSIFIAGGMALMIENNELLRKIAEAIDYDQSSGNGRSIPEVRRKEPTIDSMSPMQE